MLYIVPTPIGNLKDITARAIEMLEASDAVIAEDTRQTAKLLQHLGIKKRLISYHLHNEHHVVEKICNELDQGMTMVLVSDAGTPGISDPGFLLVRDCIKRSIKVECLPGPVAFIPALVESGLPCERFVFEGFLPHKKGRQTRILALLHEERTAVFYESPHRLLKTLQQMSDLLGSERKASVSREISKIYHETIRGTFMELLQHFIDHEPRGEIVLVVGGNS